MGLRPDKDNDHKASHYGGACVVKIIEVEAMHHGQKMTNMVMQAPQAG
jgi:hypothetical protein